ncbi:12496_t:CDS:1, partial [Entrophospora sp. SA101]
LDVRIGSSIIRGGDKYSDFKVISGVIGTEVKTGWNKVSAKVEVDVGIKGNLGVSADSGVSIGDGSVETKLVGVGFKVGKEIGISTPIGGVSIDLENFLQIFLISF